jgi:hypothetical protein
MNCCAVFDFFDAYLCRGEESPWYKPDVDPTAKCPVYVRQVVAVESLGNGEQESIESNLDEE